MTGDDARGARRRLNDRIRLAPVAAAAMAVSIVAGAGAGIATLFVLAHILDGFITPSSGNLTSPLAALAALVLVRAGCAGVLERASERLATTVKAHVRREIVGAILARPRAATQPAGELAADLVDGVERLEGYYRRYLPQVFAASITPPLVIGAAAWVDLTSAVILAITAPLVVVFLWLLGARADALARRQWKTLRTLSGLFLDTLQGLKTTILFGRAEDSIARLDESGERYRAATMAVLRRAFLSGFVLDLAATLSTALVAVGVGVRLIEGWMTFGPAIAVLLLTPELYAPIRQLGQRRHAGMEAIAAAERLWERTSASGSGAADGRALLAAAPQKGAALSRAEHGMSVRFERVSFRHADATRAALMDIDLELRPRSLTAIVGPSGAGKSTLVDLLLRFVQPEAGVIRANGIDVTSCDPRGWRRSVALVAQRPGFFDGSVLDNLRIGRPDASLDDIRAAARRAEIDAFVMQLPHGYDTALGETASRASVGERHRLALARALVRDTPLLVLDEPTSSLDPRTEAAITRVLIDEARRRTVLVVAHRLRTVRAADCLVVLDGGRLVESGRHDDLVARGGVYARFVGLVEPELESAG